MSSRQKLFFITYITANLSIAAYGVLALLTPNILLEPFSQHVYRFPDDAHIAVGYLAALFRLLGFFDLILGVLGLLLLRQYRITRQTWILRIVITASLLAYLGPIVFDNTVGRIGFFEIIEHILFVAMVLSGITMLRVRESE